MYVNLSTAIHPHIILTESFILDSFEVFQAKCDQIQIDFSPPYYNGLLLLLRDKIAFLFIVNKVLKPDDWNKLMCLKAKKIDINIPLGLACAMYS